MQSFENLVSSSLATQTQEVDQQMMRWLQMLKVYNEERVAEFRGELVVPRRDSPDSTCSRDSASSVSVTGVVSGRPFDWLPLDVMHAQKNNRGQKVPSILRQPVSLGVQRNAAALLEAFEHRVLVKKQMIQQEEREAG
jgi:hypothetical protein